MSMAKAAACFSRISPEDSSLDRLDPVRQVPHGATRFGDVQNVRFVDLDFDAGDEALGHLAPPREHGLIDKAESRRRYLIRFYADLAGKFV
jgi:hypothetical protein